MDGTLSCDFRESRSLAYVWLCSLCARGTAHQCVVRNDDGTSTPDGHTSGQDPRLSTCVAQLLEWAADCGTLGISFTSSEEAGRGHFRMITCRRSTSTRGQLAVAAGPVAKGLLISVHGQKKNLISAAKTDVTSMADEAITEQENDSRLRQTSSRHEEILENLGRTDILTARRRESLDKKQ